MLPCPGVIREPPTGNGTCVGSLRMDRIWPDGWCLERDLKTENRAPLSTL